MSRTYSVSLAGYVLLLVLSGAMGHPAAAGGCRDLTDGWLLSPLALTRLLETDSLVTPASGAARVTERVWLSCGQMRLYGMPELTALRLAAGYRWQSLSVGCSWQQLGGDLYCEDRVRLRIASARKHTLRYGLVAGWDLLELGWAQRWTNLALAAELQLQFGGQTRIVWTGHISALPFWQADRGWRRWLLIESRVATSMCALAVERTGTGAPAVQLALAVNLTGRAGLGLRAEPVTGVFGFTTFWRRGNWLLRSSHLGHPELGVTHRWSLTAGALGQAWHE